MEFLSENIIFLENCTYATVALYTGDNGAIWFYHINNGMPDFFYFSADKDNIMLSQFN